MLRWDVTTSKWASPTRWTSTSTSASHCDVGTRRLNDSVDVAYLLIHRARNGADLPLRVTNKARSEETNWQPTARRTRGCGLGVPVTKKMEDWEDERVHWRPRQGEGRRGSWDGRKREIEVTAGGGTTIVVLSPVNKGWVTLPRRTGSRAQEGAEDTLRPRLPVTAFHIQSFLRRAAYGTKESLRTHEIRGACACALRTRVHITRRLSHIQN